MTTYIATIRHHSIARARHIEIDGTLRQAKNAATKEFGSGFLDHVIIIYRPRTLPDGSRDMEEISARRISNKRWQDAEDA